MTTGQIIKQLREERGMTQEQLAELMGYSHKSSINKIEMGKADLTQSKLVAFANVLNVSPCVLVGAEPINQIQVQEWEEKFNAEYALTKETILIEAIQKKYGKEAVTALEIFVKLNKKGKTKAIDMLSDLTAIDKYIDEKE